jgi:hypothetical protein
MVETLDLSGFFAATRIFAREFSQQRHDTLRGVTDGKAIGTYIEHLFQQYLLDTGVLLTLGNSAKGIDLPALDTDIKVTSIRQPQSSSPFTSYKQKIEGLGYNLMLFVYDKRDTPEGCFLSFSTVRFIPEGLTADYQATRGIRDILARGGNQDDIFAFLIERMIPADELTLTRYAEALVVDPPRQGYLTISNALQWRLQYRRVITEALDGVIPLYTDGQA